MGNNMTLLKGIAGQNETVDEAQLQEMNVERLLVGFLRSLLEEQKAELETYTETSAYVEFTGGRS